jgi:hypothetical protein
MEGVERTKVKHTHTGPAWRRPFEHQFINKENQDCKISTVSVFVWVGTSGRGEGERRRLRYIADGLHTPT